MRRTMPECAIVCQQEVEMQVGWFERMHDKLSGVYAAVAGMLGIWAFAIGASFGHPQKDDAPYLLYCLQLHGWLVTGLGAAAILGSAVHRSTTRRLRETEERLHRLEAGLPRAGGVSRAAGI